MTGAGADLGAGASVRARPFLTLLEAGDAAELQRRMKARPYRAGEILLAEGVMGDRVMLVLEGTVKVVGTGADGREVILAMRGPGELFGELTAIDGGQRVASVVALTVGRAAYATAQELKQFLLDRPQASLAMMRMLVRRVRETSENRIGEASNDGLGRVALRLLELAERYGERTPQGIRFQLLLTQDELASWTGSSRETVARALRMMRQLGWVDTGGRGAVTVLDPEALRARARVA